MNFATGYCTNVHAGANLPQTLANLQQHATSVRERFSPNGPMGIGLWLSASTATALLNDPEKVAEFTEFLSSNQLIPYTLNGFPFGDFHQAIVKHNVYLPTWMEPPRAEYTKTLIRLLDALLPIGADGRISTLPICWGTPDPTPSQWEQAATHMCDVADTLHQLEETSGRFISLCIEPEPGCAIETSGGLVRFFEDYLLRSGDEKKIRRHLQVCHDVCHANVMFESQTDALDTYRSHGVGVGKVQISSAVVAPFDEAAEEDRAAMLEQLVAFGEDRYLHQTSVRTSDAAHFFQDLPEAIEQSRRNGVSGEWRVHFHVPVYLKSFGFLKTSQADILDCIANFPENTHYEIETYAWNVLPSHLQCESLAEGIAKELQWFADQR